MHNHSYKVYTKKQLWFRTYVFPLYLMPILMALTKEHVVTPVFTILTSVLLLFLTLWVQKININFTLKEVGYLFEECKKNSCALESNEPIKKNLPNKVLYILYKDSLCKIQKNIFIYKYNTFYVQGYEIHHLSLDTYHTFEEYEENKVFPKYLEHFPKNEFNVQPPLFLDLFVEHATAPFFVFQMFCGVLWCLDEYIYHALFTIFMLILFEMGVVFQRIKTMEEFKRMNLKPISIHKGINNEIEEVLSTELKPGDIIEINEPIKVPCDLLILEGSCAVNEAMLSGESTPFIKESIQSRDKHEIFNYKRDKIHILYAGTEILKTNKLKCYTIKTSFNTLQGNLISKMISNENTVSANNKESFLFILFLLFFAIISSIYSFIESKKLNKSNYKIMLEIIIILTNVVPPELPIELTIAVNNAVQSLIRKGIFCIEPFRIPYAGKIDVCCFDKTGTLTESQLTVHKIIINNNLIKPTELENEEKALYNVKLVISSCHSLIILNNKIEGDPMELSPFKYLDIKLIDDDLISFDNSKIKTVKRYPFTSSLRRMTTICEIENKTYSCVKGAPEVLKHFFKKIPSNYNNYENYAKDGYRVLALGVKELSKYSNLRNKSFSLKKNKSSSNISNDTSSTIISEERTDLENELSFVGFILYECKIKSDASSTIDALINSNHQVIMITGDNLLTAENVSKRLKIIHENERGVEGDDIDLALKRDDFYKIKVFARANPKHKERIIERYKSINMTTLMCGDGTNDVGALKTAHVGVAILDKPPVVNKQEKISDNKDNLLNRLNKNVSDNSDEVVIKPGDASVAASFTAKNGKLESVLEVIRHGRSALVTTIQMHKILALNSLISAFSLSVLDSKGIRFSDFQMTLSGILLAFSFMFLTTSKPLKEIHNRKPLSKIFNKYIILSIIGQTIIHVIAYLYILKHFSSPTELNDQFVMTQLNSIIFIINLSQQLSTFLINYIGRPHRENISENKPLFISLLLLTAFLFLLIGQFNKEILTYIEIVDLSDIKYLLGGIVLMNFIGCLLVEKICLKLFMK